MFLFSIAENAWGDEDLECDTGAPGCNKLCTNDFFPFSPIALWQCQMVGVGLPIIIFVSYSGWKLERIKMSLKKKYDAYQKSPDKLAREEKIAAERENIDEQKKALKNTKVFELIRPHLTHNILHDLKSTKNILGENLPSFARNINVGT